jgi:hypothetical protein
MAEAAFLPSPRRIRSRRAPFDQKNIDRTAGRIFAAGFGGDAIQTVSDEESGYGRAWNNEVWSKPASFVNVSVDRFHSKLQRRSSWM